MKEDKKLIGLFKWHFFPVLLRTGQLGELFGEGVVALLALEFPVVFAPTVGDGAQEGVATGSQVAGGEGGVAILPHSDAASFLKHRHGLVVFGHSSGAQLSIESAQLGVKGLHFFQSVSEKALLSEKQTKQKQKKTNENSQSVSFEWCWGFKGLLKRTRLSAEAWAQREKLAAKSANCWRSSSLRISRANAASSTCFLLAAYPPNK
jgi:hypothetical protein